MATLDELVISLTAETSGLRAELASAVKTTQSSMGKMEKSLEEFAQSSQKNTNIFQTALATAMGFVGGSFVTGAFNQLKDAASAAFNELVKGGEAAIAQEAAFLRLANSLAINGRYSEQAQGSLERFSAEMEALTGVADDVVASNLAMLSSLTKLDAEGLQRAQKAALDMSAALGMDLNSATSIVGKAIEGNVGALSRYGIQVQAGADKAQTLANVMGALEGRFAGAAGGAMQSFGGTITRITNSWGNLTESLASSVTGNAVVKTAIDEVRKVLDALTVSADQNAVFFREKMASAFLTTVEVLGTVVAAVDLAVRNMERGIRTLLLPINAVADGFRFLRDTIKGADTSNAFAATNAQIVAIGETLDGETFLGSFAEKIAEIGVKSEASFGLLKTSADATKPAIDNATASLVELSAVEKQRLEAIKGFAQGLVEQGVAVDAAYKQQSEMLKLSLDQGLIDQTAYFEEQRALRLAQNETELLDLETARNEQLLTEDQYQLAKTELMANHAIEQQKIVAAQTKFEQDQGKLRFENFKSTMGTIATLATAKNKELAAIGKAAAVAQATIDGYAAVQRALASAPPPFNFALAAAVGAATAANIAKIVGTPLQTGIDSVPGVGSRDNFPAVLAPGERVVPAKTNEDLTNFLANQGGRSTTINITIENRMPASREAGNAMIEAINDALAAGSLKILGT